MIYICSGEDMLFNRALMWDTDHPFMISWENHTSVCWIEANNYFHTITVNIKTLNTSIYEKITCSGEDTLLTENKDIKMVKQ